MEWDFRWVIFKLKFVIEVEISLLKLPSVNNVIRPFWAKVNIGAAYGLVPSGNKPLAEPMLTKFLMPYDMTRGQCGLSCATTSNREANPLKKP